MIQKRYQMVIHEINRKIFLLLCLAYVSISNLQAQSAIPPFKKGERVVCT